MINYSQLALENHVPDNLVSYLLGQHLQSKKANKVAIIDESRSLTYLELYKEVLSFIEKHPHLTNLTSGSKILCLYDDCIELVIVFLGALFLGLVPCIVNPHLSSDSYPFMLEQVEAKLIFTDFKFFDKLSKIGSNKIIFDGVGGGSIVVDVDFTPKKMHLHEPAFGLFSSGTTGKANLILHRHKDPIVMAKGYVKTVLTLSEKDVLFSSSKLFFAFGLNNLLIALLHGLTAILSPSKLSIENIKRTMDQYKPTIFFSVPTVYARLLDSAFFKKLPSTMRLCISAGEHLPSNIAEHWKEIFGLNIVDGIGTTETLSTFISNLPGDVKLGSTGIIMPGFLAEIRDENGRVLSSDQIGILWIKGDTYQASYAANPTATTERFMDTWFKTFDLFSCDSEGHYYYHGRANDLIKCGGIWIYPLRVENAISEHPAVHESAVVAQEQGNNLSRPVAYIVLKSGYAESENLINEIKQLCKEKCSRYEYPHMVHFTASLPKTANGKLSRYRLREVPNYATA